MKYLNFTTAIAGLMLSSCASTKNEKVGQVLQVTESRVSQLHAQAVIRLRAKLTATIEAGELEAI